MKFGKFWILAAFLFWPLSAWADLDTALVTEVRQRLNEPSAETYSDGEIQKALNRALLSRTRNYLLLTTIDSTSISTVAARPEYTLPTNFVAAFLVFVNQSSGRWEPVKPVGEDLKQKVQSAELTWYFAFKNQIRFVAPPLSSGKKVYLWYFNKATAMTFTGVECPLDDEDEPIIVNEAASKLFRKPRDANSRSSAAEFLALADQESERAMKAKIIYLIGQNENLIQYIPKAIRDAAEK